MKWLKEWAKPVFVVSVIGILANCASQRFDDVYQRFDDVDQRFVRIDNRLRVLDRRTFEMNTRLSRIEGHLGIPAPVPDNETSPTGSKEMDNDRNVPR